MRPFIGNSLLIALLLLIVFSMAKCGSSNKKEENIASTEDSTYRNLDADVKYVGIITCRQCHYDKYETFIETGMGRSFDIASRKKSSAEFGPHAVVYDKYSDLSYFPFWSEDSMKIFEFRLKGKDTVYKRIETIDYIIGSGQHTNSHLMSTNGYIHQMPITFYTQDKKWDLPPGFEAGFNSRFSRKIGIECMTCHNALPDFVYGSENKFSKVPSGIDCERCHGPGEIHVKEKTAGLLVDTSKYIDYSIVNPAKLPVDLQFDVCQRCHLQGNAVLKEGKSFFDFKPGMKLSDIETIFLPKYEGADDEFIMASHADRLKMSPCFVKANKKDETNKLRPHKNGLTCITCHNPHVSVKATGKESFNNTCKNCHTSPLSPLPQNRGDIHAGGVRSCTEKPEERVKKQDNCVSCHMPKSGSIDIPHVTVTDHFIRKPVKKTDIASVKKFVGLIAINEKTPSPAIKAQAYINQYEKFDHNPVLLDSAAKFLNERSASDLDLLIHLYYLKKDYKKIASLSSPALSVDWLNSRKTSIDNRDAWTCYRIADAFQNIGESTPALSFFQKAVQLSPYNLDFRNKLAGNLFGQNRLEEAKKIYEKILEENPNFTSAWCNIGFIYVQLGENSRADQYYNKALSLDPDHEQSLLNKAALYLHEKKIPEANSFLERLLKINPKNEQALALKMRMKK